MDGVGSPALVFRASYSFFFVSELGHMVLVRLRLLIEVTALCPHHKFSYLALVLLFVEYVIFILQYPIYLLDLLVHPHPRLWSWWSASPSCFGNTLMLS